VLEVILQADPSRELMPVSAEMIDNLREILADGVEGSYDIDAVFFGLALAVYNLENSGVELKTDLLDLETRIVNLKTDLLDLESRILDAGLRLARPK
jgi:hypothetical protein